MQDFPVFITCLISCCRPCLPLTCPPRLPSSELSCLMPLTTCSASASLASVCSPGFNSSGWPQLLCCSLLVSTSAPSAGSYGCGHLASSTSSPVRSFPLLHAAQELKCMGQRAHVPPLGPVAGFGLIPSSSLRPRDCVWAISLNIEPFAEFPLLLKLFFC